MASAPPDEESLDERIERIRSTAEAEKVAVAFHDYATGESFSLHGDDWFHAASTIKVPVLLGVFAAIEGGDLSLASRLHVRNRFPSAIDGAPLPCGVGSGRERGRARPDRQDDANRRARAAHDRHEQQPGDQPARRLRWGWIVCSVRFRTWAWRGSSCGAGWRTSAPSRRGSTTGSPPTGSFRCSA